MNEAQPRSSAKGKRSSRQKRPYKMCRFLGRSTYVPESDVEREGMP